MTDALARLIADLREKAKAIPHLSDYIAIPREAFLPLLDVAEAAEQMRREYGAFGHPSGETLVQFDKALSRLTSTKGES